MGSIIRLEMNAVARNGTCEVTRARRADYPWLPKFLLFGLYLSPAGPFVCIDNPGGKCGLDERVFPGVVLPSFLVHFDRRGNVHAVKFCTSITVYIFIIIFSRASQARNLTP